MTLKQLVKKLHHLWGLTPAKALRAFTKPELLDMIDVLTRDVTTIPKLSRNRRCVPDCPGYLHDEESGRVEACDACGLMTDEEAARLAARGDGVVRYYVG